MQRIRQFFLVSLASLFALSSLAQAQTPSAKTLVFEKDVVKRKKGFAISVVHHIPKEDGTEERKAMPLSKATQIFYKTGDKITFEIRSNFDGYLYVLHRDAKNRFFVLYPRKEAENQSNRIEGCKQADYKECKPFTFPHGGKYAFRPPKGHEHVSFVISSKPLLPRELRTSANSYGFPAYDPDTRTQVQNVVEQQPIQPNAPPPVVCPWNQVVINHKGMFRPKTLVFEADSQAGRTADYVVLPRQNLAPQTASLMFVPFFLVHQ